MTVENLNIGLIGYGKMGRLIHQMAENKGHNITAIIDPQSPLATAREINANSIKECQVIIDFSTPNSAIDNIQKCAQLNKNIVMGTTGWVDHLEEVKKTVMKNKIGFIWSSNFSTSVQLFFKIIREAARMINKYPQFDTAAWEAHHRHKIDAPSGTAVTMGEILLQELSNKKELLLDRPQGKITEQQLHLATIRVGEIPGTHATVFDCQSDTIEIKNTSRNRDGFALGAVYAAEFIAGKKGFYDFADII